MVDNAYLKRKYILTLWVGIPLIALMIYLLFFYKPSYGENINVIKNMGRTQVTENTVRIEGRNFYETAAAISQTVYPAVFDRDKPNAVILVRGDLQLDAVLASGLINHPVNAPILYVEENNIPEVTLREIERLDPRGLSLDRNARVIFIGDIGSEVINKIKGKGWNYRHIKGSDPFTLGRNIYDYLAALKGDHSDIVMIASIESPEYALPGTSWNTHRGNGFLYVKRNSVPEETKKALGESFGEAYMYILGSEDAVSKNVEVELSKFGHVQRIPGGRDIFSNSAGFAVYRDIGKNFGWWIGKRERDFGFGISEPGHNFIFVNPKDWQSAVAASLLSHIGKIGPQLLVEKNSITPEVVNYLNNVKPLTNIPQEQITSHGWIIGTTDSISYLNQLQIDGLLSKEGSD